MKQFNVFLTTLILTCFALFPGIASAGDLDDLDVTMEIIDNIGDISDVVAEMDGPEDGRAGDDESDADDYEESDGDDFESDDDFDEENDNFAEEHDFEEGEDVDDDRREEDDMPGEGGDEVFDEGGDDAVDGGGEGESDVID
jgi:hypothetical protein